MKPKYLVAIATVLALLLSHPAWAQGNGQGSENSRGNGNSNGGGNGNNGNGNGSSNSNAGGNGNGGGAGAGQNNAGSNGRQGNGNSGRSASGNTTGSGGTTDLTPSESRAAPSVTSELSESDALTAVETGRAVELTTILPDVRARTGGEVINAQLQQVRGFLLYAVTVLTPAGRVSTEYYYARSGQHVGH